MNRFLYSIRRRRRSLVFRVQAANRRLRHSFKRLHKTTPITQVSLFEIGADCGSKAELLQSPQDRTWRMAPAAVVPCPRPAKLLASQGTENRAALERSLSERHFDTPEILLGRFHDCVAEPRSIRLLTQDSVLLPETSSVHDLLDPDLVESDHLTRRDRRTLQVIRGCEPIDEDVLFAFNSFAPSYGHYLLTGLPLIFSLQDEIRQGRLKIVLPAGFPRWMTTHLLELGFAETNFLTLRDAAYRFRSAVVSNILDARNTRAPNPASLAWIAEALDKAGAARSPERQSSKTKIFVRRSGASDVSSRTISNESELIGALEPLGFQVIEPGKMTLRDQIGAFHKADVVVSPHGSTLANLLFCRPGAKVLDLMPDGWVGARGDAIRDVWGSRLCALAGLQYSVLLCPSQIRARHFTGNPTIAYNVNISDLIETLGSL